MFADDIMILSLSKIYRQVQLDLESIDTWVSKNKMSLARDNYFKITLRGIETQLFLQKGFIEQADIMKDLGLL